MKQDPVIIRVIGILNWYHNITPWQKLLQGGKNECFAVFTVFSCQVHWNAHNFLNINFHTMLRRIPTCLSIPITRHCVAKVSELRDLFSPSERWCFAPFPRCREHWNACNFVNINFHTILSQIGACLNIPVTYISYKCVTNVSELRVRFVSRKRCQTTQFCTVFSC